MKTLIALIDTIAFFLFGILLASLTAVTLLVFSFFKRKRRDASRVNRLSFVIADLINNKYPDLIEDVLLDDYISGDYSIYLDYRNPFDRFECIDGRIFIYSISAHPNSGIYKAGFHKVNALLVELRILMRAFSVARKASISFVKAHDPHLLGLNGLIVSRILRLPCMMHINSDFNTKYQGTRTVSNPIFISRGIERLFEMVVLNSYDLLMADRKYYARSGAIPKGCVNKYRTFGLRVDGRHYQDPASRRNLKTKLGIEGKKALLYVGRLHPVKYPADVMKAFSVLKKTRADAVLLIAGDGILKAHLEAMANEEGIRDSVLFLGQMKNEELVDLYRSVDILVASHGGVTLVEAALAQTPIVAYDFDWHSEFMEDGKTGYLVKFRDAEEMAASCLRLLEDDAFRLRCAAFARKKALGTCDRHDSIDREKRIYEELLGR